MKQPKPTWIYRITHIDNLPHVLSVGMVAENSPLADPGWRKIGDSSLIKYRKDLPAPDPPGGFLREYIPFYLGPRSPMLLQIASGWEDVEKIPQQDILYLISTVERILEQNLTFFFSDGHARSLTSHKYTEVCQLAQLDWDAIYAQTWKDDIIDLRRKEKKQAEFLVKNHVPLGCIEKIGVFNDSARSKISSILAKEKLQIEIVVSPQKLYYDHL